MASYFPCPNPACSYQFDAEQLPAAAMVTCPVCRTRFPYRAAAPTAAAEEDWNSPSEQPADASRERSARLVTARNVPKGNKTQTILMLVGFSLAVITMLAVIMLSMRKSWFKKEEQGETYTDQNFNFNFKRFETTWREDTALRGNTFNGFLFKNADQEAWIGLRCIPLGGGSGIRGPADGEMDGQVDAVLRKFEGLQREAATATIAKQNVKGYKFVGNLGDTAVAGEVYGFDYKGIGYVLTMWASAEKWDDARKDLAALRDSFEFASLRNNWKESKPGGNRFVADGGDFQLVDSTIGLWEKAVPESKKRGDYVRDPADEDENAVMLLRCMHPDQYNKARKDYLADVVVLVLPNVGASAEDVQKYVHDSLVRKEGDRKVDFTFETLEKQPFDTPAMPADVKGYRVTNSLDRTQKRYYAIKATTINGKTVAAVGWCREAASDRMGPYIVNLVKSLQAR